MQKKLFFFKVFFYTMPMREPSAFSDALSLGSCSRKLAAQVNFHLVTETDCVNYG